MSKEKTALMMSIERKESRLNRIGNEMLRLERNADKETSEYKCIERQFNLISEEIRSDKKLLEVEREQLIEFGKDCQYSELTSTMLFNEKYGTDGE